VGSGGELIRVPLAGCIFYFAPDAMVLVIGF
jgi:hypothetical protein